MYFYEVGVVDAIGEVCGVVLVLQDLRIDCVVCSLLFVGCGFVDAVHGRFLLFVFVMLMLLEGVFVYGVEIELELVTLIGVAFVAVTVDEYGLILKFMLEVIGYGVGTCDLQVVLNVVCAIVGVEVLWILLVSLIEVNFDDLLFELVFDAVVVVFVVGVFDVWIVFV